MKKSIIGLFTLLLTNVLFAETELDGMSCESAYIVSTDASIAYQFHED